MPKFFCDYCDVYLTHDSMSVRKDHNSGRNHIRNVVDYYQQIGQEKAQSVIDSITNSYAAEGQAANNPLQHTQAGPAFSMQGFPPYQPPGGMPMPFPPAGRGMPFPPQGMPPGFPTGFPPTGMPPLPQGLPPGNMPFQNNGGGRPPFDFPGPPNGNMSGRPQPGPPGSNDRFPPQMNGQR